MHALATADVIITANQRQALDLRRSLQRDATQIKAWPDFIQACYSALKINESMRYLSVFEQRVLWQRVIQKNSDFSLQQDDALISACMSAWQWLSDWQIPLGALNHYETLDSVWFYQVAQAYKVACQQCHGIDSQQALSYLLIHGLDLKALLPQTIVFYRFWQVPPAVLAFQSLLTNVAITSYFYQPERQPAAIQGCYPAESSVNEYATLVQWSCQYARLHPQQRIACVMQNLAQDRPLIEYYLHQQATAGRVPHVHFSLGKALIDYPIIHVTWRLMNLYGASDCDLEDLTYLSHSPFWAHATAMELCLSQWRPYQLTIFPANAWQSFAPEALLTWWRAFQPMTLKKALPSQWLVHWNALLHLSGWPQLSLSETENALLERYEALQVSFAECDAFFGELSHSQAKKHWHSLLMQTRFEVPAQQKPQIYFLGLWEALGSDFDVLWLSGVRQYHWPNFPRANALIPFKCQETYGLPKSTGEQQTLALQNLWQALLSSSDQIIVSYPLWDNAEAQKPLAFIDAWPILSVEPIVTVPYQSFKSMNRLKESLPLSPSVDHVPGGTAALRCQAHCPFQAFARYRLKLHALPVPEIGLTASERGLLVHQALYESWQFIKNQSLLVLAEPSILKGWIKIASQKALQTLNAWRRQGLAKTLFILEQQRLEALCTKWLALEALRPTFQILHLEQTVEVSFASKTWRLRMDRIDQLATGERVLIDYKTGLASIHWQAEPLLEPQLPFYALLNAEPIDALVIAQVTAKVQKIHGLAANPIDCGPLGQLKAVDDWQAQCARWALELDRLAHDYIAGKADIAPVKGPSTCSNCDLTSVCRIKDSPLEAEKTSIIAANN